MSFPLVGNLSDTPLLGGHQKTPEGLWTSQNDNTYYINVVLLMNSLIYISYSNWLKYYPILIFSAIQIDCERFLSAKCGTCIME